MCTADIQYKLIINEYPDIVIAGEIVTDRYAFFRSWRLYFTIAGNGERDFQLSAITIVVLGGNAFLVQRLVEREEAILSLNLIIRFSLCFATAIQVL